MRVAAKETIAQCSVPGAAMATSSLSALETTEAVAAAAVADAVAAHAVAAAATVAAVELGQRPWPLVCTVYLCEW